MKDIGTKKIGIYLGNEDVAKTLSKAYSINPFNEPDTDNQIRGGSLVVSRSKQYIQPTTLASYPQLNSSEMLKNDLYGDNPYISYVKHPYGDSSRGHNGPPDPALQAGFLSKKDLKKGWKFAKKNIIKPVLKEGVKYAKPFVSTGLQTLGVPAPLSGIATNVLGNLADRGIEGLGYNQSQIGMYKPRGRGRPKLDYLTEQRARATKTGGSKCGTKTGGSKCGGKMTREQRGQLIKKLMKEKGMNLGQASKYIKENM
jgi:hypothetical protein